MDREVKELTLLTDEEILPIIEKYSKGLNECSDPVANLLIVEQQVAKAQLDKALNLRYPCEECGGVPTIRGLTRDACRTCGGTGQGGKVLAVLAEKQDKPEIEIESYGKKAINHIKEIKPHLELGASMMLTKMTTPDKDGYVWKKIIL